MEREKESKFFISKFGDIMHKNAVKLQKIQSQIFRLQEQQLEEQDATKFQEIEEQIFQLRQQHSKEQFSLFDTEDKEDKDKIDKRALLRAKIKNMRSVRTS